MSNFDTFDEYRQSSVPYQPNERYAPVQSFQGGNVPPRDTQAQRPRPYPKLQPSLQEQKPATPARMPKAQALALLRKVKRGIVVASFLGFGTFSALALGHTVGATTQQASTTSTVTHEVTSTAKITPKTTTTTTPKATSTTTSKAASTTTTPKATATTTTTQQGGGYGFGSSTSTSNPVSGSHTS